MCDYMCDLSIKKGYKQKGEPLNSPLTITYEWPLQDSNQQPKDYEDTAQTLVFVAFDCN